MFIFIFRPKKNRRRSGRDKKIALDAEAWREKERAGVATTHERHGPLTEEERLKRTEAACLRMQACHLPGTRMPPGQTLVL